MQDEVKVTQADIDAAQSIIDTWFNRSVIEITLARHRQQAERAFEERERKLREALETLEAALTRDMGAGYAGVALCQALKDTQDAQ